MMSTRAAILSSPVMIRKFTNEYAMQLYKYNSLLWILMITLAFFIIFITKLTSELTIEYLKWFFIRIILGQVIQIKGKIKFKSLVLIYIIGFIMFTISIVSFIHTKMVTIDERKIENLDDIRRDPEIKILIVARSSLEPYFIRNDFSSEYYELLQKRGYGRSQTPPENDDVIGLFELGDEKYKKDFMAGKLSIIGDRYLIKLMIIPNCKLDPNFRYYISKEAFHHTNLSFGYSKCADPKVREIIDRRMYIDTESGTIAYSITNMFYRSAPSLLNVDTKQCQGDNVEEIHYQVNRTHLSITFQLFFSLMFVSLICIIFELVQFSIILFEIGKFFSNFNF